MNAMLGAVRITEALDHYEQKLKQENRWIESGDVEGARWNAGLAAQATPARR